MTKVALRVLSDFSEVSESQNSTYFQNLKDFANYGKQKVNAIGEKVFSALTYICIDANTMNNSFRKLDKHVLNTIEYMAKMPGFLGNLRNSLHSTVGFVDTVQIFPDMDYFYNKKYKSEKVFAVISKIFVTISDVTGAMSWLAELQILNTAKIAACISNLRLFSFVPKVVQAMSSLPIIRSIPNLSKVAATVGEMRVFSFVEKLSLDFISWRALTIFYVFCALDAVHRLLSPGTAVEKTQASIDLASFLSELVLDALITVGVTNIPVLGVTGAIVICLCCASLIYKMNHLEGDSDQLQVV